MDISTIVNSVVSLFLIMLVGVYATRRNIITDEINRGLTDILLNIALPFLIISSFILTYDDSVKTNVVKTFYLSIITFVLIGIVSYILLFPIKGDRKIILQFSNVFTNTGYVGFPILNAIYGSEGILYGSIFQMFYVMFIWTYGIMLFKERVRGEGVYKDFKKTVVEVIMNPSIIAVLIGIMIMAFNIKIPDMFLTSIRSIANITGPLSMIIVGGILSKVNIRNYAKDITVYYGIILKLFLIPGIIYFVLKIINDVSIITNSLVILAAMPAAIMTSIFAEGYNKEKEYATVIVFFTTIISIITIPLMLKLLL